MDFLINSWYDLSQNEKDYFQNKTKKQLQDRWLSDEGKEITRRILEMCFTRGKSKNYAPYVGYCTSTYFKNELLLDLRGFNLSKYSNLFDEKIVKLDFTFCNLEFATFKDSELAKCNFHHSNLAYTDFSSSILDNCNFSKSNLSYCNFEKSELEAANIKNTKIDHINLFKANIENLEFNKAISFENINLSSINDLNNYQFIKFINTKYRLQKKDSYIYKVLNFLYKYI